MTHSLKVQVPFFCTKKKKNYKEARTSVLMRNISIITAGTADRIEV